MAFLSSPSSTNEVDTAIIQVSIFSSPVSTVSSHDNTANLSNATVYAFLANQPNGSQLVHEDLKQIHEDDLEETDLKWQLALLSMRARRYFKRTCKKITINGSDIAGYDKTKVECFNCHKMGHFARECRSPRNQESRPRNQDSPRKTMNVEDTSSKAMVAIDGAGFDWSYMADDEVPTNVALMAFSESEGNKVASAVGKQGINVVKSPSCWVWRPKIKVQNHVSKNSGSYIYKQFDYVDPEVTPQDALKDQGYFESGCSRHMTGNISYLTDLKKHDRGYVAFRGGAKGGKITRKGTIKIGKPDFKDVYFVKELQFNLFSVSQMCDKKNSVLFTDTGCFVLSPNFILADESQVLLKGPRKKNMYSFDMKNIVPQKTRKVKENLHITFLENKPMIEGGGPEWLFNIDALSKSMNYAPVPAGTNSINFAGKGASFDAGKSSMETRPSQDYILMPLWKENSLFDTYSQASDGHNKDKHGPSQASENYNKERPNAESSTKTLNTTGPVNSATPTYIDYPNDPLMLDLEDTRIFDVAYDDKDEGPKAYYNNLESVISIRPIPSTRIYKDHPKEQILREVNYAVQTKKMAK
nr:hypothetical protein [Tanacetum cinerariifolium]